MRQLTPALGQGKGDLGEFRVLLAGVPGRTDRGWLGYCTVLLFSLDDGWALFDTGHQSDRHLLVGALSASGLAPGDIRHVVLSHLHFDHSLNLPLFPRADLYLSRAERDYARRVSAGELTDHSIPDHWPALLEGRRVHLIEEELLLPPAGRLRVLPGHTPGCMALFGNGAVACGDVIKNGWEAVTGKAGQAAAGEEAASASIAAVKARAEAIIPGHDSPFRLGPGSIEYLQPFRLEVRASLYPDPPERSVLTLERRAGPARNCKDDSVTT